MKQYKFPLGVGQPFIKSKQRGLSLIELLISMTIGLIILAAGSAVYISSARGSAVSEQSTRLNEDGVLALNYLQSQLRQAGYYKKLRPQNGTPAAPVAGQPMPTSDRAFYLPPVRGCTGTLGNQAGYMDVTCAAGNGDALVVQYEADVFNTFPTAARPNLPTNCNGATIANPYTNTDVGGGPVNRFQAVNRFFVANNTLMCRGNTGPATVDAVAQPLFPNVEQMVVRYGIAAEPMIRQENEFNAARDQVVAYVTAANMPDWNRVRSVNICLMMRSQDPVNDGSNVNAGTDCNGAATPNDNHLRRTFVSTVMLRNRMVSPDQVAP